jgi:hypothetical protein
LREQGEDIIEPIVCTRKIYRKAFSTLNSYYNGGMILKKRMILCVLMISLLVLTLTGCVPGDGTHSVSDPAGFLWGIWHGWLAPISILVGFFDKNIRVYEVMNTGWWYDFGFYIAVISGFGGISLFRKDKKAKNCKKD